MTRRIPTRDETYAARSTWWSAMSAISLAEPYSSAQRVAEQAEEAAWKRYREIEKAYEHNLLIEMP